MENSLAKRCLKELLVLALLSLFTQIGLMGYLALVRPADSGQYLLHGLGAIIVISLFLAALFTYRDGRQIERGLSRWVAVMSFAACFFVLVPVTVERSVSMYLLETFNNHPKQHYSTQQLNDLLREEYICHRNAAAKRMEEQQMLGLVEQVTPEAYQLSNKGREVMSVLDTMYWVFSIPRTKRPASCAEQTS